MKNIKNTMSVPFSCPYCQVTTNRTIQSLKNCEPFHCNCGAVYTDDDYSLKDTVILIEKELENLASIYSEAKAILKNIDVNNGYKH